MFLKRGNIQCISKQLILFSRLIRLISLSQIPYIWENQIVDRNTSSSNTVGGDLNLSSLLSSSWPLWSNNNETIVAGYNTGLKFNEFSLHWAAADVMLQHQQICLNFTNINAYYWWFLLSNLTSTIANTLLYRSALSQWTTSVTCRDLEKMSSFLILIVNFNWI